MLQDKLNSRFLAYIVNNGINPGDSLPPLTEMSQELDISVGKLREHLELARSLGVVSVKPRVGIQRRPYNFAPAVLPSVLFGLATGEAHFSQISRLRQVIEADFWDEAVRLLTPEDKRSLQEIVDRAWSKLRGKPVHVPNQEHRQLHLTIFKRLDNPFVQGLLSAYWDAYEASELTRFVKYQYWVTVWEYHEQIVAALSNGAYDEGQQLLVAHFALLPPEEI